MDYKDIRYISIYLWNHIDALYCGVFTGDLYAFGLAHSYDKSGCCWVRPGIYFYSLLDILDKSVIKYWLKY